jgi:transcriptional regulator of acetoin/glycerol metabolism
MTELQRQRHHLDSILHFMEASKHSTTPPSSVIGRSWQRCLTDYGLDPSQPRPARIVTHQTLKEHQGGVDEFLNVARAGVEQLYQHIAHFGYVLLLTDHRGITVQYLGDRHNDDPLRKAGLYLGADWSERYAGTCAVGTCIQEQAALTCHQIDHFDASHINLTCTAAPIRDPDGNLLAVLDISALRSSVDRGSQQFALHLTELYAQMIEDAYFLRRYRHAHVFRAGPSREFVQVNGQWLIALDEEGRILAANTLARRFLTDNTTAPTALKGSFLHERLDCEWQDLLSIQRLQKDGVQAFRATGLNQPIFGSLIEPKKRPHKPEPNKEEAIAQLDTLACDDPSMRRTLTLAKRLRNRDVSLLILGETGTGKELLSRAIHDTSLRAERPFIAVNCAAIPESLIESELFGYTPGTFTGGRAKGAKGLIEQADGGTLFLDEIGDMPLHLQTRLLRVLAEGEVMPLGSSTPIKVDCRIIAATHCDLHQLINQGLFRSDLFYRLNGATLKLPALRHRADKQYVINTVLGQVLKRTQNSRVHLRGDAMSALLAYQWPGNIRQLVNALSFAEATCDGIEITVQDLPDECQPYGPMPPEHQAEKSIDQTEQYSEPLGNEFTQLQSALRQCDGNVSEAARLLNVSRPTVYRWIRKYGIEQAANRYWV